MAVLSIPAVSGRARRAVAPSLAILVWGCAAAGTFLPTPEDLRSRGFAAPGADAGSLRRGRALFVTECGGCHRLPRPSDYSPGEWRALLPEMGHSASLDDGQIADLHLYLAAASRWNRPPAGGGISPLKSPPAPGR